MINERLHSDLVALPVSAVMSHPVYSVTEEVEDE